MFKNDNRESIWGDCSDLPGVFDEDRMRKKDINFDTTANYMKGMWKMQKDVTKKGITNIIKEHPILSEIGKKTIEKIEEQKELKFGFMEEVLQEFLKQADNNQINVDIL